MNVKPHFQFANSDMNPEGFVAYWYGTPIGYFSLGAKREWHALDPVFDEIFAKTPSTGTPMFLHNLGLDSWLKKFMGVDSQIAFIKTGKKYLSNIMVNGCDIESTPLDILSADLSEFQDEKGTILSQYTGPRGIAGEGTFNEDTGQHLQEQMVTRVSGMELKIMLTLKADGKISEANGENSADLIGKFAETNGREILSTNEYLAMSMARAAGLETPPFGLIDQGGDLPPIYVVQRYDIPQKGDDISKKWLITQDFCTLLGLSPGQKTGASIEQVSRCIKKIAAENKIADQNNILEKLFKRTVMSWIVNDADMHLKNISLLYTFDPTKKEITNIDFAPTYDITTDIFSGPGGAAQCLQLSGKKDRIKLKAFVQLAQYFGIFQDSEGKTDADKVENLIRDMAKKAAQTGIDYANNMHDFVKNKPWTYDIMAQVSHVVDRARDYGVTDLDWDSKAVWNEFSWKGAKARRDIKNPEATQSPRVTRKNKYKHPSTALPA